MPLALAPARPLMQRTSARRSRLRRAGLTRDTNAPPGRREILRLREDARARLGAAYDIRDFHASVLGRGYLPLPVLRKVVEALTSSAAAA